MKWGLFVVPILFFIVGCTTTTSSTPELISVQAVPTQRHYYTPTPDGLVNVSIQTAIPLDEADDSVSATLDLNIPSAELWQPIVITVKPIPAGYAIPPEALRLEMWATESLPTGYYQNLDDVINQVTLVALSCHEPVLDRLIARRQAGTGFLPLPDECEEHPNLRRASHVVVASRDIQVGETITPASVQRVLWHYIPRDSFVNLSDVIGSQATSYIFREQILTSQRVTGIELKNDSP